MEKPTGFNLLWSLALRRSEKQKAPCGALFCLAERAGVTAITPTIKDLVVFGLKKPLPNSIPQRLTTTIAQLMIEFYNSSIILDNAMTNAAVIEMLKCIYGALDTTTQGKINQCIRQKLLNPEDKPEDIARKKDIRDIGEIITGRKIDLNL
jgi:hypothetical protein